MRLTWAELMDSPPEPPPQLCPGVPEVGVTVLAGSPKVGKTLWASQQALECGKPTLMVIEEGGQAGISYRMRRQADELGLDAPPPIEVWHRERIQLDRPPSVKKLRDHVASMRPALVVLDPLNRLHGADENRPTQMTPVMDALSGIAYDYGCAVLAIHHLSKPSAERRGDIWDRFRGASAIRSGTDANLALDGTGERLRLVGEFRDAEPLSRWLELDREALVFRDAEAPEVPAKVDAGELREFVQERGQVNARQVMERFEVSKPTALTALRSQEEFDHYIGARGEMVFTYGVTVK